MRKKIKDLAIYEYKEKRYLNECEDGSAFGSGCFNGEGRIGGNSYGDGAHSGRGSEDGWSIGRGTLYGSGNEDGSSW